MRRSQRLIAAAVLIALSGALAGCSSSLSNFDPSDLLDFLDTKKKPPGERKPVSPDGWPGLEQGVPKELYKGSAQERLDQQNAQAAAAASAPPPQQPKSKHAPKSQGKPPATASTAPTAAPNPTDCSGSGAAGSQAQENRAPAHHRAAARSARATGAARAIVATICCAIPGPDAARHLLALISFFHRIDTRFLNGARIAYVFHDCHYRPAQCRKIDAVQPAGRAEACAGR